jgi:hypothetical protein
MHSENGSSLSLDDQLRVPLHLSTLYAVPMVCGVRHVLSRVFSVLASTSHLGKPALTQRKSAPASINAVFDSFY